MKPPKPSPCNVCGKLTSGGDPESCAYCRLQLGLESGFADSRSSWPSGADPAGKESVGGMALVRLGVLPEFGDYELQSELARGGMGVVYRARQRSLNRTVAVKLILAGQLATLESVQRFRLEAEAAARLHHPGIVRIFEVGEFETQHFFSMELIEGVSLAECLDAFALKAAGGSAEKRSQQACIAELMATVARALDFAHHHGVLHRDLKPSNILIDEQGKPHLTDFGLAKLTGREASGLTLSHAVLGTPGYVAPEQAAGRLDQVTTAADVYGLGATLYTLLTGQPPFVGSTAFETMRMAIDYDPTPPRQLNPAVHPDLETIALRCLEKQPERRYASAAEVADELERFQRHEPIQARPITRWEYAWRWRQRNPWLAGMAGALLLAILVGGVGVLWQWSRAENANLNLTNNLQHLEWRAIDTMLEHGESSHALAQVASLLRDDPHDQKAAMFAMSILEQRRFPVPAAATFRHPGGAELSVARISPDGTHVATGSFDGSVRIWNALTASETVAPLEHQAPVTWVEFSPDGRLVATCSRDKSVRLWEVATGAPVVPPYRHQEAVTKIQFSRDGVRILARGQRSIVILEGRTLETLLRPLSDEGLPERGSVLAASFVSEGSHFYAVQQVGGDSLVRVWESASGEETASVSIGRARDAQLSEDQKHLLLLDNAGRCWVSDFPSNDSRREIVSGKDLLRQVGFNRSGDRLYTIGMNQSARVWSTASAIPITSELPHYFLLNGASFLKDGERLLTWGNDSLAQVWDIATSQSTCEPLRHTNRVEYAESGTIAGSEVFLTTVSHIKSRSEATGTGLAKIWQVRPPRGVRLDLSEDLGGHDGGLISDDGRLIAISTTDQKITLYESGTGKRLGEPLRIDGQAWGMAFSPDGRHLIATTNRGQVSVWSLPEGKLAAPPVQLPTTFQPLEMIHDGQYFATGSTDGFVRLWDTAGGRVVHEMSHGAEINSLAFSPDGQWLASAGEDRVVRLWDVATGDSVGELRGHRNEVMAVRFSPDSRKLVSASLDFSARVWDAASARELVSLPHQGEVVDAAFSPDGNEVATASRDRTAVIWDARTGMSHSRPLLHEQAVRNVQFSPDGTKLLTLDFRGLRLWDTASGHPVTVHLPHLTFGGTGYQSSTGRPNFSPDGNSVLVVSDSRQGSLWRFSIPPAGAPVWFPELLEAVAGQRRVAGTDRSMLVPTESFLAVESRLRNSSDTDYYTRWARRWLFGSDHSSR